MSLEINTYRMRQALELIRNVRNNVPKEEFERIVDGICARDGNVRYPLMEAGIVAAKTHRRAVKGLEND